MIYFQTKKDLEFLKKFKHNIHSLYEIENAVPEPRAMLFIESDMQKYRQEEASKNPNYQGLREEIAKNTVYATRIISKVNIGLTITSYPAPAVGGPVIYINMLDAILNDYTHGGVEPQLIIDTLNKTIGIYERLVEEEFYNMINPLYWIKSMFLLIIKMPYNILKLSGFDVAKIEQALWGKAINLLWMLMLIKMLIDYGFNNNDILSLLLKH